MSRINSEAPGWKSANARIGVDVSAFFRLSIDFQISFDSSG